MIPANLWTRLSKSRKKRPVPEGWATPDDIASFQTISSDAIPVPQATSIGVEGDYAAIGGLKGDIGIYSIEAGKLERSLQVNEPITDTIWSGSKIMLSTSKGSLKIYESGQEVASFTDHAGPVTALAMHPSGSIVASVGSDKSIVFYGLDTLQRAMRVFTDTCELMSSMLLRDRPLTHVPSIDDVRIPSGWPPSCGRYNGR